MLLVNFSGLECVVTVVLLEVNAIVQLNRGDTLTEASLGVTAHTCAITTFSVFSSDILTQLVILCHLLSSYIILKY